MSRNKLTAAAVVLLCFMLVFSACGADKTGKVSPQGLSRSLPAPAAAPVLPELTLLAGQTVRGASALALTRDGSEIDLSLAPSRWESSGSAAVMSPAYLPGGPLSGASYAMYAFDASGYSGPLSLELYWDTPPLAGQAWLALSNFSTGHWDWFSLDPAEVVQNLGGEGVDYQNGSSTSFAVLLLTGSQAATLAKIRLGPNALPTPSYTILPGLSVIQGDPFSMDAGASYDSDGFISKYEFDFGAGGGYEDNGVNVSLQHIYSNPGDFQLRLRLTDNDGAQSELAVDVLKVYPPGSQPTVSVLLSPQRPRVGKPLTIDASGSIDADGTIQKYLFDPENDGSFVDNGSNPIYVHTYDAAGKFNIQVRAVDDSGLTGEGYAQIGVGWLRSFQGLNNYADVFCTQPDAQGNVYACGVVTLEEGNPDNFEGAFVLKLNANGETQWIKQLEQVYDQAITDLAFDSSGNLWAAGYDGKIGAAVNPFLLRINSATGELELQKEIAENVDAGFPVRLAVDSQDRINLGFSADYSGVRTMALVQFLNTGALNWTRKYDTESSGYDRILQGICVDSLDRVYLAGSDSVDSMGIHLDAALACIDGNGTLQWARRLGENNLLEEFLGVCGSGPYVYACGNFANSGQKAMLAQFSAADGQAGFVAGYSNSPGGFPGFVSCCPDPDNGCLVSGSVDDLMGDVDACVLHYDSMGLLLSELGFGISGTEEANYLGRIAPGQDGALFWSGEFDDPSTGFSALMGNSSLVMMSVADLSGVLADPGWTISDALYGYADLSLTEDNGGGFVMRLYP